MSPLVVASVLPAGRWFDVVIFDEASQIPPAQAISAISRATQVVVAGDERQLPPTSFFTAAVEDDSPAGVASPPLTDGDESILDVLSVALPIRRLSWHYRSQDERLISFANAQLYDGALVTFPGTSGESVLRLEVVDGSAPVQPGLEAIESTPAEVDHVVQLVLSHARNRPGESLGVIALGIRHAENIEEALRVALAANPSESEFFDEDRQERFFVKNLERVQGDERDAIILSIGYGKTPHGRMLHRFGPLNLEGGERRLNVAITRARRRMTVVSSFAAAELDPVRLKARGAIMLRDFLLYAAAGGAVIPARAKAAAQLDPLVANLAVRLRAEGLVVHAGYGASAQRLDLAVEDPQRPGRVLVAVEADGLGYAAMSSTRDRDRLRVEQLRRLGWKHVRIWSTDLFRNPARDVARVIAAVHSASASRPSSPGAEPAKRQSAQSQPTEGSPVEGQPAEGQPAEGQPVEGRPGQGQQVQGQPTDGQAAGTPASDDAPVTARPQGVGRPGSSSPEQSHDDTDAGWGERPDEEAEDRWLREQRPPHWG
jgi:hypothetical protein